MDNSSGPEQSPIGNDGGGQTHSGVDWRQLGNLASHISSRGGADPDPDQFGFDDIQRM